MFRKSLAFRLLTICFLCLAFPLLLYSFFFFNRFYEDLIEEANKTLEEAALYRLFSLEQLTPVSLSFLYELEYLLNLKDEIPRLPNVSFQEKLSSLMKDINTLDVYVLGLGKDDYYPIIGSTKNDIGQTFESHNRLKEATLKEKGNFLRYLFDKKQKRTIPYLYSVLTIYDSLHHPIGFLAARSEIYKEQMHLLEPFIEDEKTLKFAVVDENGLIQAATDQALEGHFFHSISPARKEQLLHESYRNGKEFFAETNLKIKKRESDPLLFEFSWEGQTELAAMTPSSETGITVLAYVSKKQLFAEAMDRLFFIYLIFGLIVLLGLIIILFLTNWLSTPLNQLLRLMKRVKEGNLNARYRRQRWGFEFNFIGEAFNQTIGVLLQHMQKAEDEKRKKEIVRKEIEIAKNVQRALLPKKIPKVTGVDLYSTYFATEEVGGDFYDFFVNDEKLYLITADASGLGLSPCLYALNTRSFFRAYAHSCSDTGVLMQKVNNAFYDDAGESGMFVTAIAGIFHTKSKILTYYSAGHLPGLLRKKNGEVILLDKRGMALGLQRAEKYNAPSFFLEEGDVVLFYTDGVIEAINEKNQSFSLSWLVDLFYRRQWNTAEEIVEGIKREVLDFIGETKVTEEFVIVAMKVT